MMSGYLERRKSDSEIANFTAFLIISQHVVAHSSRDPLSQMATAEILYTSPNATFISYISMS